MTDQEKINELIKKHQRLSHAMQTGVMYHLEKSPDNGSPKHLRVGINVALCDHAALVRLLIAKEIITEIEYYEAIVKEMEDEVARYTELVRQLYGTGKITLH